MPRNSLLIRNILVYTFFILLGTASYAQDNKKIQKSWIKTSIEDLSGGDMEADTLYTRYSFAKSKLHISFNPGWDTYEQTWSMNGNKVTIGIDSYEIEELTDTSLTISLFGFRRMKFLSEEYFSNQDAYLDSIEIYNGKPLFKANHFITPRYTGKAPFRDFIGKNATGYDIKRASYFRATFVVTEEGRVENVKIIKSITDGFDNEIVKQLLKTSKQWKPAYFKNKPIQTEMFYDIKYLNSLVPYSSGTLH